MLTPNPNECNSTLSSVTGGTYPHPDTYIYKCSLVVWNLGSPCNLRAEDLHSFINLVSRVVLEQHWLSQAIPRFLLVGNFLNRTFKNRRDSNSVSPI